MNFGISQPHFRLSIGERDTRIGDADGYSGGSIAAQFFSVTAVTILGLVKFLRVFSSIYHLFCDIRESSVNARRIYQHPRLTLPHYGKVSRAGGDLCAPRNLIRLVARSTGGGDVGSDYRCGAGGTTLDAINVRLYACRGHTISTRTSADFALLRGCHQ
jgi:hypothetical protein